MANIFILEDDITLSKGIAIALKKDHYNIIQAYSYFEGVEKFLQHDIDLFLLDINLPDGNGVMFCKKIREMLDKPIIFITANDTEEDMITGYDSGCDDYIAKPFSLEVLRKKVEIILKKSRSVKQENILKYKDIEINYDKMTVKKQDQICKLTVTEYRLLECLAKNRGKVLTRSILLESIWDVDGNYIDENTLSVNVRRLRHKLEDDPKNPQYIITVFGIGYTFGE